jgi:outer membrane protein assembly factor BamB
MKRFPGRFSRLAQLIPVLALAVLLPEGVTAEPVETKIIPTGGGFAARCGTGSAISNGFGLIGAQAADIGAGDTGAIFVIDLATGTQVRTLAPAPAVSHTFLGCSVAACGDLVIGGAQLDDTAGTNAGAAYIFDFTDGTQLHRLTASNAEDQANLGVSVDICESYAIAGAYKATPHGSYSGSAYLYDVTTGEELFAFDAADGGSGDWYGRSVAVSEQYAVVGAPTWDGPGYSPSCGAVYVYDVVTRELLHQLTADDLSAEDRFGFALDIEGDRLAVGSYWDGDTGDEGSVYIFDLISGDQLARVEAQPIIGGGDNLGTSVALHGNHVLAGATQQTYGTELRGFACLFDWTTGAELLRLEASDGHNDDEFGQSVAFDGNRALIGADMDDSGGINYGSAYIYQPIQDMSAVEEGMLPSAGLVLDNYPNPFNPRTEFNLSLPTGLAVDLDIFDVSGRRVRRLLRGASSSTGMKVVWDGRNDSGLQLPSGTYFCRAEAGVLRSVRKVMLLK